MIKNSPGFIACILILLLNNLANAENRFITVASTTSAKNSGLFEKILPIFTKKTGIQVRVVAVGTGQAFRLARNGDADVLFVHHKPSELKFVEEGYGVKRFEVMYNDFVIVGPNIDPAKIKGVQHVSHAFINIANLGERFISRADNSGTHKRELFIWESALINPKKGIGKWYYEVGAGMGTALNITVAKNAHTIVDRGTWLSFKNKANLIILFEKGKVLRNPYGIILVNPRKFKHVKANDGYKFINWMLSEGGQSAIKNFKINGQQLFYPNANSKFSQTGEKKS